MLEAAIAWFNERQGKVTYSMVNRNGPASYDCSSAVYYSLIYAAVFPTSMGIGDTDTLFNDLERHGFTQVAQAADGSIPTQRGDVFIWGVRGQSAGSFGHTGIFLDADNIIHCSAGYNGIAVSNHDWLWGINGKPPVTIYRLTGTVTPPVNNPTDQIVEVGSSVKFDKTYTVNDLQDVANLWQIKTDELCKNGFTWADNGIPAGVVTKVDADGYATASQELAIGDLYRIPGKFNVMDLGLTNGEWLAEVGAGGLTFWVDIATATEIAPTDPGVPTPVQRQTNVIPTPTVTAPPVVAPVTPPAVPDKPATHPDPTKGTSVPLTIHSIMLNLINKLEGMIMNSYNQPTAAPTSKVTAVGVAGIITTVLVYLAAQTHFILPPDITGNAASAMTALLTLVAFLQACIHFAAGYFKKSSK